MKVPLALIGKAKTSRCFRKRKAPVAYFGQKRACSATATIRKRFYPVFIPFARKMSSKNVALVMENCGQHRADLLDSTGQVSVITLPPNCTSMFQLTDMGVTASFKVRYRSMILNRVLEVFGNRNGLRESAIILAAG